MTWTAYAEAPGYCRRLVTRGTVEDAVQAGCERMHLVSLDWPAEHSPCLTVRRTELGPPDVQARLESPRASLRFEHVLHGAREKYIKYAGKSRREYVNSRVEVEIARARRAKA